jgi:flagellar basal body-associated protein FliL
MRTIYIVLAIVVVAAAGAGYYFWRAAQASNDFSTVRDEALAFYQQQNPTLTGLSAKVIDYGCHIEIEIRQNGNRLARLGWAGPGQYYVIGR